MTIGEHILEWAGKPVVDWEAGTPLADPDEVNYRISVTYEEEDRIRWTDKLGQFLDDPAGSRVTGIVIGPWEGVTTGESAERVVEALVAARDRLPALRALFFGDITYEESEISWINQSDVSPLLHAYPQLEHFAVRGGEGLTFGTLRHDRLKTLIVQTGGLSRTVTQEILAATLPQLEHLEIWLGSEYYGGDTTVDDLAPLLAGTLFPQLRYLGLRDSELTDEIAIALENAPILERVKVLDLSLGTLSDAGAAALLANPAVARLEKLDVHHHYLSEEMVAKLQALPIAVDVSEPEEADDGERRYVAVSE